MCTYSNKKVIKLAHNSNMTRMEQTTLLVFSTCLICKHLDLRVNLMQLEAADEP